MSDDWDADDFEPLPPVLPKEPEKSQWDDEDAEVEAPGQTISSTSSQPKPKADKKKKKAEESPAMESEVLADPVAEKLRQQRLVEEADLSAAKELFGAKKGAEKSMDDFIPKSEEEFVEFAELVAAKVTPFSKSFHYIPMLKAFVRKASESLSAKDAKELNMAMSVISNEKLKQEKDAMSGKKKTAAKKKEIKLDAADEDYSKTYAGPDEDYDFM